jgi:hypothetical protein
MTALSSSIRRRMIAQRNAWWSLKRPVSASTSASF